MMKANKKVMAALLAAMMTVSAGAAVVSAGNVSGPGAEIPTSQNNTNGWNGEVVKLDDGTKMNGYYYQTANKEYAKCWRLIDGKWYYFTNKDNLGKSEITYKGDSGVDSEKRYAIMDKKVDIVYPDGTKYTFRFGKDGAMITGWYQVSNATDPVTGNASNWEYYNANGVNQTGWFKVGANWFFITSEPMTVEFKENTYWVKQYLPKGTLLMNGTYKFNGKVYTFAANGVLVNEGQGWVKEGNNWYYVLEDGSRFAEGWKEINGKWYYFTDTVMRTGWIKVDGKWYYLTNNGDCVLNNWVQNSRNGEWYLTNASGEMVTGWAVRGGKTYFLNDGYFKDLPYGVMATGTIKMNGNTYTFDASGALVALNGQHIDPGVIPTK